MDKNYNELVKKITPKEPKIKNYTKAFFLGGLIGLIGEIIRLIFINYFSFTPEDAINYTLIIFILISCILTATGKFDNIVSKYKCGLIIPITGFAHSIMACALDYKKDGLITGIGSNFFKLAGSVILYGIVSGFFMGMLKVILNVWI